MIAEMGHFRRSGPQQTRVPLEYQPNGRARARRRAYGLIGAFFALAANAATAEIETLRLERGDATTNTVEATAAADGGAWLLRVRDPIDLTTFRRTGKTTSLVKISPQLTLEHEIPLTEGNYALLGALGSRALLVHLPTRRRDANGNLLGVSTLIAVNSEPPFTRESLYDWPTFDWSKRLFAADAGGMYLVERSPESRGDAPSFLLVRTDSAGAVRWRQAREGDGYVDVQPTPHGVS